MLRRLNPSWLVALIPLWMIWQFGSPLPVFDDWDFLFQLHSAAERGELLKLLPLQANESRPLFPRLIALPLDRAFGGDLRARMVATWLLMCVTAWLLSRLGNSLSPEPRRGAILLLTNALLFAPIQLENWLWGNQLMFVMPLPCLAGILYLLCHPPRLHAAHVAGACVLAGIATWSFANGLLCWVAVLACLALRRAGLLSLLVALAAFGINATLYFSDLYVVRRDAWYAVRHPLDAIRFLLSLIGSPFALGHDLIAPLIGAVAVFALAAATWRQRRNATAYPFLVLAAYALVSLAVVTSGRLEMGASQAFASRYTTVAVLVYVALAWLLSATLPANRWALLAWCVVFAMHTGHSYFAIRAAGINARATRFAHLCLSLPRPTEGDCAVYQTYPNAQHPLQVAPVLEGFGMLHRIPVDVPRSDAQPDPSVALVNMQTNTMADHRWRISGTVHTPTTPDAVLFVADGQVWAAAFPHPAEKAESAYTFSATLPSAIRQVRVYIFRQGAPWTFAANAKP